MAAARRDVTTRQVPTAVGRLQVTDHPGDDPLDPGNVGVTAVVPQFFGDAGRPDALPTITAWTAALFSDLDIQDRRIAQGQLPAWTSLSAWSSVPSTGTSTPTWLPTSPACSRGPTSTW